MKRNKGGAIISVLLMSTLLLSIGLALGTLSSISLNMAKAQTDAIKGTLMARSALDQLHYTLYAAREQARRDGFDLTTSARPDLMKLFKDKDLLATSGRGHLQGMCELVFSRSEPYYCVDNTNSEYPAAGWMDKGKSSRSVPPFSLLLVFKTVQAQGLTKYYEALLEWHWDYAGFCATAPITLAGMERVYSGDDPGARYTYLRGAPTVVKGNLFTFFDPNNPEQAAGIDDPDDASVRARLFHRRNSILGARHSPYSLKIGQTTERYVETDKENKLHGDVCIFKTEKPGGRYRTGGAVDPVVINEGNELKGRKRFERAAGNLLPGQNPADFIKRPDTSAFSSLETEKYRSYLVLIPPSFSDDSDMQMTVDPDEDPTSMFGGRQTGTRGYNPANVEVTIITRDLDLVGTPGSNRFYLRGNLSNCFFAYRRVRELMEGGGEKTSFVRTGAFYCGTGLKLKDCVLFVDGDVCLSERPPGWVNEDLSQIRKVADLQFRFSSGSGSALSGDNATLIVNGLLKLTGGSLDSKDRGMVIFAKDIQMASKGDFKGLIMASECFKTSIDPYFGRSIIPQRGVQGAQSASTALPTAPPQPLTIRGGIICGGKVQGSELKGLELTSTRLIYDPRYLKAVHGFGSLKIAHWRPLP